ncbi:hypothetical protein [Aquisphaera giovannonii]|uniref:hypothetical protein n=1 Tax=Aquisphaera giovannonii TaxID=406548 RepID=UPI0011E01495|nr:hypothetical protein [Aquisphaera giovannonii]
MEDERPGTTHKTILNVDNHTLRDLWIKISADEEHTEGPRQVNNGQSISCDSDKVRFGNAASYHIDVWRNDNGHQGGHIGGYDTGVRFNGAGFDDTDELVVVTVGGKTHLQALSQRKAGEVVGEIILA